MKIKLTAIISLLVIVLILGGCFYKSYFKRPIDSNSNVTTVKGERKMDELNERQKQICQKVDLPTDINELDSNQKASLMRIEELLQHLDNKYGLHFNYLGYSDGGSIEEEWLKAYPDNLNEYYFTKLIVHENGEMEDDYAQVILSIVLGDDLERYLNNNTDNSFKVFASDCKIESGIIVDSINDAYGKASGTFSIYIKGKNNNDDLDNFAEVLTNWYTENKIYGYANFIMVSDEYFEKINIANYKDTILEDNTEISMSCDCSKDGDIKIY